MAFREGGSCQPGRRLLTMLYILIGEFLKGGKERERIREREEKVSEVGSGRQ